MLDRLRSLLRRDAGTAPEKSTYLGLRSMAFTIDPETLAFRPDAHVHGAWCAVVDFGQASGSATLVAIADGTVSLYTTTGGGVLGAGGHDAVWDASVRLLDVAGSAIPFLRVVNEPPVVPGPGNVRLTVRTFDGMLSDEAAEATLQRGRHVLSPLYAAAQDVLTEVRLSTEVRGR
jgi:hypothetical protein